MLQFSSKTPKIIIFSAKNGPQCKGTHGYSSKSFLLGRPGIKQYRNKIFPASTCPFLRYSTFCPKKCDNFGINSQKWNLKFYGLETIIIFLECLDNS